MLDALQEVPMFADLTDDDLILIADLVNEEALDPGTVLFDEGQEGDSAYLVREGELEIFKQAGEKEVLLALRQPGEVVGEMSLLLGEPRMASARARGGVGLVEIPKAALDHLIVCSPSATATVYQTVLRRWQSTVSSLQQHERMAQLGTLTAGVAHELNNPAAAVERAAGQLQEALERFGTTQRAVEERDQTAIENVQLDASAALLDPLDRSDREYDIEDWLVENGFDEPDEMAVALVEAGFTVDSLDELAESAGDRLSQTIDAASSSSSVHRLVSEIHEASGRLTGIVRALKSYSFLDQAPLQDVDIPKGLDDTLLLLGGKTGGVTVTRDYEDGLPRIEGYGSELNQVWTNLLDNALDAVDDVEGGTVTVSTKSDNQSVFVEISDNGHGIPVDIKERIFDPFFTTKEPGKGTGLGLEISYGIVVNRHLGDIEVDSEPGSTTFRVVLPIRAPKGDE